MYIKVKVIAGARREQVEKIKDDEYRISVCEKAERNLANTRVRELIAREYTLPVARVRIISGHQSLSKILSLYMD